MLYRSGHIREAAMTPNPLLAAGILAGFKTNTMH